MECALKILVVQIVLNGARQGICRRRLTREPLYAKDAEWPGLVSLWVRVFPLRGRPDLPAQSTLENRLQGRPPTSSHSLRLHEKVIG